MDFCLPAFINTTVRSRLTMLHLIMSFSRCFPRVNALAHRSDIILHLNWIFCLSNWANPWSLFPCSIYTLSLSGDVYVCARASVLLFKPSRSVTEGPTPEGWRWWWSCQFPSPFMSPCLCWRKKGKGWKWILSSRWWNVRERRRLVATMRALLTC